MFNFVLTYKQKLYILKIELFFGYTHDLVEQENCTESALKSDRVYSVPKCAFFKLMDGISQIYSRDGRYEKCVHREVANAKPYRIRDSAF